MKTNKQKVIDFIVDYTTEFQTTVNEFPKFDTKFLSDQLNMQRSNISSILNQLVKEKVIEKTNGRPVLYYLSKDQEAQNEDQIFSSLIGSELSLKETIQLTKAAITYPMRFPRILYLGEKGVGVTTLALKIFEFACSKKIINKEASYVAVDCLYYSNQQMEEMLVGEDNVFLKYNHGMVLLKNMQVLESSLVSKVFSMFKDNKQLELIFIAHISNHFEDSYLKDYFNFCIPIVSLQNRTMLERFQFIEYFFHSESVKLKRVIEINNGLLQCLMLYPCPNNLIDLKNNIQFGIANALLRTNKKDNIVIELSDLPGNVRKGLLYIKDNINELESVLGKNVNYVFRYDKTLSYKNDQIDLDIYTKLDQNYNALGQMAQGEDKDTFVFATLENEMADYIYSITNGLTNEKLNKIVSGKLRDCVKEFMTTWSIKFNQVYSNDIYYGLCIHLNNALIRKNPKQQISNENIMSIIDVYDEEYLFSRKFIKSIEKAFNVHLTLDESVLVTLMMTVSKNKRKKDRDVMTLVAMHGKKCATSIVEVVKTLMPVKNIEAFDLSLEDDIEYSYDLLKEKIISINQGKGVLVLYDMGSIQVMLDSIMDETKIAIRTIEVPIPLLAMSACKDSEEGKSLVDIYQHVVSEYAETSYSRLNNKDIIIALSSIKENNSESIKRYLQTLEDYRDYQILAFNITDKQNLINKINEIQIRGKVIGIVGTYNPEIFNIRYIDYQHLPDVYTIHELFAEKKENFDVIQYLTEQFEIFDYEDLATYLIPFVDSLEKIFNDVFDEDTRLGMVIHMGCLIDRLYKKQSSAVNFNMNHIKHDYSKEFDEVSDALSDLERVFDVTFSESDKATIVEIIMNYRKRK